MTKEEANNKISLIESRISNYEDNIRDINSKINKLNELLSKVGIAKNNLDDFKDDQIVILNKLMNVNRKSKMLDGYHDDISDIITGVRYTNAIEGFDSIQSFLSQKIEELENQIQQLQNSKTFSWNEISSLKYYTLYEEE